MSALATQVRGWCPGALRPMESGDGLIVRVRPRGGALQIDDLCALADAAERCGNGLIDLTRRANVQVRGLAPGRLAELWAALSARGLIDAGPEAEAVRNVMVSPLAGCDPGEAADMRGVARALEQVLAADPELQRLPAKFGFVLDGGGLMPLDEVRADIRLVAVGPDAVALGVERPHGVAWLGTVPLAEAAHAAAGLARGFLGLRRDARARLRDLDEAACEALRRRTAHWLSAPARAPTPRETAHALGPIRCRGTVIAAGFAPPLGRLAAPELRALADAAARLGVAELRLSPWRALYAPVDGERAALALLEAAAACGFIVDADDPLTLIDACPGAPGCRATALDTRAAARRIAPLLAALGCRSCHVSGCAKGCARSKPADLVLVGAGDRFGIARGATAQAPPRAFLPPGRLGELPALLQSI